MGLGRTRPGVRWLVYACISAPFSSAVGQECQEGWTKEFPFRGISGEVRAMGMFDLGQGPSAYVAGGFYWVDELRVNRIARRVGDAWEPLGSGIDGDPSKTKVFALAAFDEGSGPMLYAGGWFESAGGVSARGVARWDGDAWHPTGDGISSTVRALAVFDNGSGDALYAAVLHRDGQELSGLCKWDGTQWKNVHGTPIGESGISGGYCLRVFDDGTGSALYVGGRFDWAGGLMVKNAVRWDGKAWSALGDGLDDGHYHNTVLSFTTYDDGNGAALYASGDFERSGESVVHSVARWTGAEWLPVGKPEQLPGGFAPAIAAAPDGGNMSLFATMYWGGAFSAVYRWSGVAWESIGETYEVVRVLTTLDWGMGPRLWAGGYFRMIGDTCEWGIAEWSGTEWVHRAPSMGSPSDMIVIPDGPSRGVYAAGAGCWPEGGGLVRWDGTQWTRIGYQGRFGTEAIAVVDGDEGPAVYTTGQHENGWPFVAYKVEGEALKPVGLPLPYAGSKALAAFDDGNGPKLYAGGAFYMPDGSVSSMVRLEDDTWQPVAWVTRFNKPDSAYITSFAEFDDGNGPRLYVGGDFDHINGVAAHSFAAWDGEEWISPGGLGSSPLVRSMAVFNDGRGPGLYVAGSLDRAGGNQAGNIARWSGDKWTTLSTGTDGAILQIKAGTADGRSVLAVVGDFATAGGLNAHNVATWDGAAWHALSGGVAGGARSVLFPGESFGDGILFGGDFGATFDGQSAYRLARYHFCPPPCPADCALSGSLDLLDYLCFSALFDSADPAADCDGSGALDLFDFLCFVNAFNAGC